MGNLHRIGAIAVAEGGGVDLFELDLAGKAIAVYDLDAAVARVVGLDNGIEL